MEDAAERIRSAVERARFEAALLLADRRKDEFLAVLAHELRNGLAPVVYNAEIGNRSIGDAGLLSFDAHLAKPASTDELQAVLLAASRSSR